MDEHPFRRAVRAVADRPRWRPPNAACSPRPGASGPVYARPVLQISSHPSEMERRALALSLLRSKKTPLQALGARIAPPPLVGRISRRRNLVFHLRRDRIRELID